jgi:hypothetical protein
MSLLRNLDMISYDYIRTRMHLRIVAADVAAIFLRTYHCFARAAFPPRISVWSPLQLLERVRVSNCLEKV